MKKVKIEDATKEQLNYATAIAQGWELLPVQHHYNERAFKKSIGDIILVSDYYPTDNNIVGQFQCGRLIDKFKICTDYDEFGGEWSAKLYKCNTDYTFDKSRQIATVRAYLWSVYSDGMIEVCDEI